MSERGVFAVDRGIFEIECIATPWNKPFGTREAWIWLGLYGPVRRDRRNVWRRLAREWHWDKPGKVKTFLERMVNAGLVVITDAEISAREYADAVPTAVRPGLDSWRALRQAVFERDGFACTYCGDDRDLACDHIIPRSRGGRDEMENLTTACKPCNSSKSDRTPEEWRR